MSYSKSMMRSGCCRWISFLFLFFVSTLTLEAHTVPAPLQLSFGAAGGTDPVIALDSKGNIDVAWIGSSIFFARSTNAGQTFSDPKEIQAVLTSAASLQIGLDIHNNINLSWTAPDGIFFARSTNDGQSFSTPAKVNTASIAGIESLQMVIETKGAIDLTWLLGFASGRSTLDVIFSRSTDGGATFSAPVDAVSTSPNGFFSGNLQSLGGPKGQIYIFMTKVEERGGAHACTVLFSRSTDYGETFSAPTDLSSDSGSCSTSRATVDWRGDIDVALSYSTFDLLQPPPQRNVLFRRSTDNGASFSAPIGVSGKPQFFNDPDIYDTPDFQIFAGVGCEIYIVWRAFDPGASTLFFARSRDNGETFSSPRILSGPPSTSSVKGPALAVDAHGNINVAWSDANPSDSSAPLEILFTRSRDEGKVFQNPKILTAGTGLSAVAPKVVLNHGGEAYLIWQGNSSTLPSQVFFSRVPSSFSQPVDFQISVSPKNVTTSAGDTIHFTVTGHDLDDVPQLDLICTLLPASAKNLSAPVYESTCTFDPPSISTSDREAHLTLTIPPLLLTGSYFLGVSGIGDSTFNVKTVLVVVGDAANTAVLPPSTDD